MIKQTPLSEDDIHKYSTLLNLILCTPIKCDMEP